MTRQKLTISQRLPDFNTIISKSKSRYSYNMYGYTALARETISNICLFIRSSGIKPVESCFLDIVWVEKTRKRDPDNIAASIKFILDAMQKEKVINNDGWKQVKGWRNSFCLGKNYKVLVTIEGQLSET